MKKCFVLTLLLLAFLSSLCQTPPTPSITSIGSTLSCNGNGVWLESSAKTGNLWSTGSVANKVYVSQSGTYTVVQNTGTLSSLPSAPITVSIIPAATLFPLGPVCIKSGPIQFSMSPVTSQGLVAYTTFKGIGIIGSVFDPAQANVGNNNVVELVVMYVDGSEICVDSSAIRITVMDCTPLSKHELKKDLQVYPNPSQGIFYLENDFDEVFGFKLFDTLGNETPYAISRQNNKISVSINAPPGVYLLELKTGNKMQCSRLVKM